MTDPSRSQVHHCDACGRRSPDELGSHEFCQACKPMPEEVENDILLFDARVALPEAQERFERAEAEVKRLRQGLWDCAVAAGIDTDGNATPDHLAYPDIVKFALDAVCELRQDYDDALDELPMLPDA